jgi:hypothetical protein
MPLKALQAGIRYAGSIFDEQPKLDAGEQASRDTPQGKPSGQPC